MTADKTQKPLKIKELEGEKRGQEGTGATTCTPSWKAIVHFTPETGILVDFAQYGWVVNNDWEPHGCVPYYAFRTRGWNRMRDLSGAASNDLYLWYPRVRRGACDASEAAQVEDCPDLLFR